MKQEPCTKISSEDKKITIIADNDTSLGKIHDFLLFVKGEIIDRIVKSQEEEAKAASGNKEEIKVPDEKGNK